jgi:glutathione synthase/RimK-type ligase-like ATP-grasp enzyme
VSDAYRPRIAVFRDDAILEPPWADGFERCLAAGGVDVVSLDRIDDRTLDGLREVDGFMWRFTHAPRSQSIAKRVLGAVEGALGVPVWPDAATRWHYDDKAAQAWLLALIGAPTPETRVFTDKDDALAWARATTYPQVFKLSGGASSQSVCLVRSFDAAARLIGRGFYRGLSGHHDLDAISRDRRDAVWRRLRALPRDLAREALHSARYGASHLFESRLPLAWPIESRAFVFQEYLPDNEHDHRITVIGERAFGFRRFRRPGDFRISGSGILDFEPSQVDPKAVEIAHGISSRLAVQSMAYDFLRDREGRLRLLELSYTFVGTAVAQCPGYWDRQGTWHDGRVSPQEAIAEDFLAEVRAHAPRLRS